MISPAIYFLSGLVRIYTRIFQVATVGGGLLKYIGNGILTPSGKIYFAGYNMSNILKLDIVTNTTTTIAGVGRRTGGVLADNGMIYFAPRFYANQILKLDPSTDTASSIGSSYSYSNNMFTGGIQDPVTKMIYFAPMYGAPQFLKLDPITETTSLIGTSYSGADKIYGNGALASNGMMYFAPHTDLSKVLKLNPSTDTTSLIGDTYSGSAKWMGEILSSVNGKIYCIPFSARRVLKIDPDTDTTSLIGTDYSGFSGQWGFATEGDDGMIYCTPYIGGLILRINPYDDTTSLVSTPVQSSLGAVTTPNGDIYLTPSTASTIQKLKK